MLCIKIYIYIYTCTEDYDRIISQLNNTVIDAEDQHQCFLGVAVTLARDKNIQQAISDIHRMTHPFLNPQFLIEADAASSATELLSRDFIRELGVIPPDEEEGQGAEGSNATLALKDAVKKAMVSAEFNPETVDELLSHLFKSDDGSDGPGVIFHASRFANSNARNAGFKNFSDLRRRANTSDAFDARLRVYGFQYSIHELIELANLNRFLLSDDPAHFYRSLLAQFCRSRSKDPSSTDTCSRIDTIASKTRRNAARLLTRQPKTLTLNEWACQGSTILHRIVPRKTITKITTAANKTELDLHQLGVFTCYLCPSTGNGPSLDEADTIHDAFHPLCSNNNASLRHANVYRFVAHDGADKVFQHIQEAHSEGFVGNNCYLAIPCRSCIQSHILKPSESSLSSAWVCCADCGLDHQNLCHGRSDRLVALYNSLGPEFSNDLAATAIIKKYLFSKCFACGGLFDQYKDLTVHQNTCFASFACLSSGYGKPLSTAAFFTNNFLRVKEDEAATSHALGQLAKVVEELHAKTTPTAASLLSLRGKETLSLFPSPGGALTDSGRGKGKGGGKTKPKGGRNLAFALTAKSSLITHSHQQLTKQHVEIERETRNNDNSGNNNDDIVFPIRRVDASSFTINASPLHYRHHDDGDDVGDETLDAEERIWLEAGRAQRSAILQEPLEATTGGSSVGRDTAISPEYSSCEDNDDDVDDNDDDPPLKKKKQ